jgi:hypothetical protein
MNTIYTDPHGNALISCPHCGKTQKANVSKYIGHELVVNCNCGQAFVCRFEYEDVGEKKTYGVGKMDQKGNADTPPLVLHLDTAGRATFTCPNCGYEKTLKAPGESSRAVCYQVKCKCGQTYACRFEPSAIHKPEQTEGTYSPLEDGEASHGRVHVYIVGKNGTASIVCRKCGSERRVNPKDDAVLRYPFRYRCKCGHTFVCRIEQREHYRKELSLKGKYINQRTGDEDYTLIKDISLGGLSIMPFNGSDKIREGDILKVSFDLEDGKGTVIDRLVRVKSVLEKKVGCEFLEKPLYDQELGFYSLP